LPSESANIPPVDSGESEALMQFLVLATAVVLSLAMALATTTLVLRGILLLMSKLR
jgi:hypothetical protein